MIKDSIDINFQIDPAKEMLLKRKDDLRQMRRLLGS